MCSLNKIPDHPKENRIIYDWVSFTTRKHTLYQLIELLGLKENTPWETVRGAHGFQWRQYFNGISIHFNIKQFDFNSFNKTSEEKEAANKDDFIWLEMSGQGCRAFETYGNGNYEKLFGLARDDPDNIHITRIDIAFDDMTGVFDIDKVCDEVRQEHFVARTNTYQSIYSNAGNAVYFGSKKSNVFIRIYDKAKERGFDNKELHWIRYELQLKDINAMGFIDNLQRMTLQDLYLGVIKNYVSFKEPTDDSNKRRWPDAEWWSKFIDEAIAVSVYSKPGVEYNMRACERYIMTQPLGSIKTMLEVYGQEAFINLIREAPMPKNPKYKQLIESEKAKIELENLPVDKDARMFAELRDSFLKQQQKIKETLIDKA